MKNGHVKTIGFIDYYISEWHANHYPEWIKQVCEKTGKKFEVRYAWAEEYVSPVDGKNTDEWCKEYGVERCETIAEICEKADYLIVLAPSDPEKHLGYAQEVLKYKKNTYIDKTFAPDYATAKEIFAIGEKYGTKFFSSSALRFGNESNGLGDVKALVTTGGGGNIGEYIIHQIEPTVKILKARPVSLKTECFGEDYVIFVTFESGKTAIMNYATMFPFAAHYRREDGSYGYTTIESSTFINLLTAILEFFETGELPFDPEETLYVMKIREGVIKSLNCFGEEIKL